MRHTVAVHKIVDRSQAKLNKSIKGYDVRMLKYLNKFDNCRKLQLKVESYQLLIRVTLIK